MNRRRKPRLMKTVRRMKNKLDLIKNYNQMLLAIAGTIGLVALIISCFFLISDIMPYNYIEDGMIATEETEVLVKQNLRERLVSFQGPRLIDSTSQIYLIPVGQSNLNSLESGDAPLGLINNFSGSHGEDLATNNIVVYKKKLNKSKIVF